MADLPSTLPLAWRDFRFEVPAEWEVVGYSFKPDEGRLALADGEGETLQVFWKKTDAPPDLDRRLGDLLRANLPPDAVSKADDRRIEEVHGWRACLSGDRTIPFYAARHLSEARQILGVIFAPHPRRREEVARAVLASWTPNAGPERRWSALGLDLTLPAAFEPEVAISLPALQRMEFATRAGDRVILHRFGMLSAILEGTDPAAHFARIKGRGVQVWKLSSPAAAPRLEVAELALRRRPIGWWSAPRRLPKEGRAWLWPRLDVERLWALEIWTRRDRALIAHLPSRVETAILRQPIPPARPPTPPSLPPESASLPHRRLEIAELLRMIPTPNAAAERAPLPDGGLRLAIPLRRPRWVPLIGWWLPISKTRRIELDRAGVAALALFDGTRTLGEIVALHQRRWKLSELEARGMILDFLRPLVRSGIVALVMPKASH